MKKLNTFNSVYFRDKSHFEENGTQNYLVSQPTQRYFKRNAGVDNGNHIYYWRSKGLSDEKINSIKTSHYGITPYLFYYGTTKIRVKFNGGCLKQGPGSHLHWRMADVYIVYEISKNNISDYPTL